MNVISCSRRTDVPRLYPDWLQERLAAGRVVFRGPRGGVRDVSLKASDVHSIVLWSKGYGPLLAQPRLLDQLSVLNPFFHFTITGLGGSTWEPGVPAWEESVVVMKRLADLFGAQRVNWRFDPVVHWRAGAVTESNLTRFLRIGEAVASLGITTCTFSFAQWYRKSVRRCRGRRLAFVDPEEEEKHEMAARLAAEAKNMGLRLDSCSQASLESVPGLDRARCVNAARLVELRGGGAAAAGGKDRGQRAACGCNPSIDIGSYSQRCPQPCAYCYAN